MAFLDEMRLLSAIGGLAGEEALEGPAMEARVSMSEKIRYKKWYNRRPVQ